MIIYLGMHAQEQRWLMKRDWKKNDSQSLWPVAILDRIRELQKLAGESGLRRFAIWAASQAVDVSGKEFDLITEVAGYIDSEDAESLFRDRWSKVSGAIVASAAIGLQHNPRLAYAQIAAFQTVDPDPVSAAMKSSCYARRSIGSGVSRGSRPHGYPDWLDQIETEAWAFGLQIDHLDALLGRAHGEANTDEEGT